MEHKIVIKRFERDSEFHIMYNGGVAHRFDAGIFSLGQILTFAKKQYSGMATNGDTVNISLDGELTVAVCKNCGSTNVEVKVWYNEESGFTDVVSDGEDDDTYCNDCGQHAGIEYKKVKDL
jgi:hypothetical protein